MIGSRLLFSLLLLVLIMSDVQAQLPQSASLATLIEQLGDKRFQTRVTAQKRLLESAKAEPVRIRKELRTALTETTDPEVKFRLQAVLRAIGATLPIQQLTFSEAGVKDKTWQMLNPPQAATFSIREGVLDFDSTEKAEEAVMFVHYFKKERTSHRLVLDAEIKVHSERRVREGLAGVHLNIEDGSSSYGMMIQDRGVFAYRSKSMHAMDTTDDWHRYRMVIEGSLQRLFVDDMSKPIIELRRPASGGRYWISFGDGTAGAGARAQIRNVKFSRYEVPVKSR